MTCCPGGKRIAGSARCPRCVMNRWSSSTLSCAVRPCAASEMISKAHSPVPDERGHQRAIRGQSEGNQRTSEAIRGNQRAIRGPSEAIRGNQRAIRGQSEGHQRHSEARLARLMSDAIRGQSEAIRGTARSPCTYPRRGRACPQPSRCACRERSSCGFRTLRGRGSCRCRTGGTRRP